MSHKKNATEAGGFYDLDGTWFRGQMFVYFIEECVKAHIMPSIVLKLAAKELDLAKQRKIPYEEYIRKQVSAYCDLERMKDIRVQDVRECAKATIERMGNRVHVFTRELASASLDVGIRRVIVSGSPHQVVEEFAKVNNIHMYLGTEHPFTKRNGVEYFTGGEAITHFMRKDIALKNLSKQHHLDLERSYAIGDSIVDAAMFRVVKYPICFNPERKLAPLARENRWPIVIEEKNLNFIFRPDENGKLVEVSLSDILPESLAGRLKVRLQEAGWPTEA